LAQFKPVLSGLKNKLIMVKKQIKNNSGHKYWRIRVKWGEQDLNKDAWDEGHVGIWYGKWTTEDWLRISKKPKLQQFRAFQRLRQPSWRGKLRKADFDTAKRFASMKNNDWIIVFFDNTLHLAQISGGMKSAKSNWNKNGESYKYRKIHNKKSFSLEKLPDPYRLLPCAGRGNVNNFCKSSTKLIEILIKNRNEKSVVNFIRKIPFLDWLEQLGPGQWESLCLGYLILKDGYLPTGLVAGKTLRTLDIVGRNRKGYRIIAQCKKNPYPISIPPSFLKAYKDAGNKTHAYLFAYGGVKEYPEGIIIETGKTIRKWLETKGGNNYAKMWSKKD